MKMEENSTWSTTSEWPPPETGKTTIKVLGVLLIFIPIITLLGNLLVIIAVIRFRALQSAINFLILGLAVADLLVAITVMPYAVYVYITSGDWQLGDLMCDIYMASDVACSTASILLLAVISFDRYRAVSQPIQYSRQAQNIRRVLFTIASIWIISLALASPIVFGVNVRPHDANRFECRFYNAEFSIGSSMISFVMPCVLVLFVYIRIIIALKKRERAAKLRRDKARLGLSSGEGYIDEGEAGKIVAGPVVNVMMAALPSMSKHIRKFERHRRAIELAGDEDFEDDDLSESDGEVDAQPVATSSTVAAAGVFCRIIAHDHVTTTSTPAALKEQEFGGASSTPRSSMDSLSDNVNVITNDFISENCTTLSRRSSVADMSQPTSSQTSYEARRSRTSSINGKSRKSRSTSQNTSLGGNATDHAIIPSIIRTISRRSPRIFRREKSKNAIVLENHQANEPVGIHKKNNQQLTDTETVSLTNHHQNVFSRSTTANSAELLASPDGQNPGFVDSDKGTKDADECHVTVQPTVSFALKVHEMEGNGQNDLKDPHDTSRIFANAALQDAPLEVEIFTKPAMAPLARLDSVGSHHTRDSFKSNSSKKSKNGAVSKIVKKTVRHEISLKRKVSKAQRKEKRATKTLGVVVGVFLVCWVPFFAINIQNAICMLLEEEFCQVGYELFFYCTWLGYMNSFMNPIIYTIFNTEFRRAFKSIIFGRKHARTSYLNAKKVNL